MQKKHRGPFSGFILALVWAGAGAGCLSVPIPQAEADPARFYVLNSSAAAATAVAGGEKAVSLHLQPVEVASYLRSRTMIVRLGDNEIQFREFARWGESLETGIARVLREELLGSGAVRDVFNAGIPAPGAAFDQVLSVRVLACEGGADGSVLFRAAWELVPAGKGPGGPVQRGDFRAGGLRWDGKTEASLAAQLSAAVAALAGEVSAALKK